MRETVKRVHFIGIGGIGMSGIAEVLLDLGFEVSGSDLSESVIVERLRKAGAEVFLGHDENHIAGADAVVYSSAIDPENSEKLAAEQAKIPLVPRAEMLGELMRFRQGIAIAGTHGKTTTTSLVSTVLADAGIDPTCVVGGVVNSMHSNARLGKGEWMVVEADESDASFLHLQPHVAVVTNIDQDHMDTYGGDFSRLKQTYLDFLHNLPFYGLAILCFDDPAVRDIATGLRKPFETYGFDEGVDYRAVELSYDGMMSTFRVIRFGQDMGEFSVSLPGQHNVLNALAAIAVAYRLEIPEAEVRKALSRFEGIGRRFQGLGWIRLGDANVELVDDYAHHPRELDATLRASAVCWPGRRVVPVFQPHRYSRTRDLFDDFAELLSGVENLVVTEVYPAGEQPLPGSDGRSLCRAIRKRGNDPVFVESLDGLVDVLSNLVADGDVVLTLGAGDIGRFALGLQASHASDGRATE